MQREKIEESVKTIVVEQLHVNPEQVNLISSFVDDLSVGFLEWFDLLLAFEEYFDVEIPTEDEGKMKTVGAVVDWLDAKLEDRD